MEETVLDIFEDVKFIQGGTKMNQTNWQEYFGTALPNGIYEGLQVQDYYGLRMFETGGFSYEYDTPVTTFDYPSILTDGAVFVNGLMAQIRTEDGYTEIGRGEDESDRFICLRVYLKESKAQIIQKTGIAEFNSTASTYNRNTLHVLNHFVMDESYCCERNEYFWDVPIFYQAPYKSVNPYILSDGSSLRRVIYPNKKIENAMIKYTGSKLASSYKDGVCFVSGNNFYNTSAIRTGNYQDQSGTHEYYQAQIYIDNINCPDGAIVQVLGYSNPPADAITDINFQMEQFTNTVFKIKTHEIGYGTHYTYDKNDPNFYSYNPVYRVLTKDTVRFRITNTSAIEIGRQSDDPEYWASRNYLIEVL